MMRTVLACIIDSAHAHYHSDCCATVTARVQSVLSTEFLPTSAHVALLSKESFDVNVRMHATKCLIPGGSRVNPPCRHDTSQITSANLLLARRLLRAFLRRLLPLCYWNEQGGSWTSSSVWRMVVAIFFLTRLLLPLCKVETFSINTAITLFASATVRKFAIRLRVPPKTDETPIAKRRTRSRVPHLEHCYRLSFQHILARALASFGTHIEFERCSTIIAATHLPRPSV